MIEFIYSTLASIGFTHPLHPIITHIPMGMVIGGFLFILASLKWDYFEKTAFYCYVLALIFVPPTALFGILDWQHRLYGKTTNLVMAKLVLTGIFTIILSITVYLDYKDAVRGKVKLGLYTLCFLVLMVLGFIGGELAYG